MSNPKPIEHKLDSGTLSINIESTYVDGYKRYILTFFFEHHITCKTYSCVIKLADMILLGANIKHLPGVLQKYLNSPPGLRVYDNTIVAIFTHPDYPMQPIQIKIPMDAKKSMQMDIVD